MSRSRKNTSKASQNIQSTHIDSINIDIDYEQLAQAILKAQNQLDIQNKAILEEKKKQELDEWHQIVNYKECPPNSKQIKKLINDLRNLLCGLIALITFKKENAKGDSVTFNILRSSTSLLFYIAEVLLLIAAILLIVLSLFVLKKPLYFLYAIICFLYSRIFRVAKFEVENINDRNYLMSILSTITCYIAMILALIALFKV